MRIPSDLKRKLKVLAEKNGKSITELIIQIIEKELKDER
ncbi:ribbon-helix-helix protein, CopG family [Persephonella sp.]